jgi:flagellar hook-associated protein 2
MSNTLRITGLASGLDVDATVKQLMKAHNLKLDKIKQDKQIIEWKQEIYRDIIGDVSTFKSSYFDVLKGDSYMLSEKNYSSFTTNTSDNNLTFKATASGSALTGDYKITVNRIAEKANITGNNKVNIEEALNSFKFPASIETGVNDEIMFDLEGTQYKVTLDAGVFNLSDLVSKINNGLVTAKNGPDFSIAENKSSSVKAVLSNDGTNIKFVGTKTIDDTNKNLNVNISGTDYLIELDKGTFFMDELAAKITSKLSEKGISANIKAETSDDGNNIHFYNQTLTDSDVTNDVNITVNGTTLSDKLTPTIADDTYSTGMAVTNSDATTKNTLEYNRNIIQGFNDTLNVKVNGINYTVTLADTADSDYGKLTGGKSDIEIRNNLVTKINDALKLAKDSSNATVDLTGSTANLTASLSIDGTRIQLKSSDNKTISISGNGTNTLGFTSSFEVSQSIEDKMGFMLGGFTGGSIVDFTINDGKKDVRFRYDFSSITNDTSDPDNIITGAKNKTIEDIMDDVASRSNTKLSYSQLTRSFSLESNSTGASENITLKITEDSPTTQTTTSTFLTNLFGTHDSNADNLFDVLTDTGEDAIVNIKNPNGGEAAVYKSLNNFTIDGVNYNLIKADVGVEKTLTVTSNTDSTFDKVKSFIDKYNELIDKINSKISEKKQYNYLPLTDEQRDAMSEDEIKNWETKAKQGLLSRDSTLENMLYSMRRAFSDMVKINSDDPAGSSIGITLSDIGLTTSSDISMKGKIVIDETKLRDAIKNNGDKVAKLFTKTSTTVSSYSPDLTENQKTQRYNDSGIFQRINDILLNNVRTTRNANGQKGTLLEKAGIKGDYTEFNNLLTDELKDKEKIISDLTTKLSEKEDYYYLQFSKLETAMQKLNQQSNWLNQQLGLSS